MSRNRKDPGSCRTGRTRRKTDPAADDPGGYPRSAAPAFPPGAVPQAAVRRDAARVLRAAGLDAAMGRLADRNHASVAAVHRADARDLVGDMGRAEEQLELLKIADGGSCLGFVWALARCYDAPATLVVAGIFYGDGCVAGIFTVPPLPGSLSFSMASLSMREKIG